MRLQRAAEEVLIQYLLGNLTEEEQVRVEDRAFADADYMVALESAEADLIDSYVRGELSQADRRRFELRFLTSARRREKVEFARTLSILARDENVRKPSRPSLASVLRGWSPILRFAAGMAVIVCMIAGSWLVFENAANRSRIAALESQRRAFEVKEQLLQRQLSEERNARNVSGASQAPQTPNAGRPPLVASLILFPGVSRAQTRVEQLVLTPSSQIARIEMQLESRDNFPRFRAELRTRSGEQLLSAGNLTRRKVGDAYVVSFDVPTSALRVGEYELALQGVTANRSTEDLAFYYFNVQKR